jgi:hypothetical protein
VAVAVFSFSTSIAYVYFRSRVAPRRSTALMRRNRRRPTSDRTAS